MLESPAPEYQLWSRYFEAYGSGDWMTHYLLAELIGAMLTDKDGKRLTAFDVAPFLMTPEIERHLREEKTKSQRAARRRRTLQITEGSDA